METNEQASNVCADCGAPCIAESVATGYAVTRVPRFSDERIRTQGIDGTNYGTEPLATDKPVGATIEQDSRTFPTFYDVESEEAHHDSPERRICYACAAILEKETMVATGRTYLYLTTVQVAEKFGNVNLPHVRQTSSGPYFYRYKLSNWPGNAPFNILGSVRESKGRGFGGAYPVRTFRFVGPDGFVWSGRSAGNMDLARCKRTKQRHKGN